MPTPAPYPAPYPASANSAALPPAAVVSTQICRSRVSLGPGSASLISGTMAPSRAASACRSGRRSSGFAQNRTASIPLSATSTSGSRLPFVDTGTQPAKRTASTCAWVLARPGPRHKTVPRPNRDNWFDSPVGPGSEIVPKGTAGLRPATSSTARSEARSTSWSSFAPDRRTSARLNRST